MDESYKDSALTVKPLPAMRLQWLRMVRAKVTVSTPVGTKRILSARVVRWRVELQTRASARHVGPTRWLTHSLADG